MFEISELPLRFADTRTFIVCITVFLLISWWSRQPRNLPPGPWRWPVVGCLPNLGVSMYRSGLQPLQFMANLAVYYGDIYGVYVGSQLVVILNSAQSVREAFQNQYLIDRPKFHIKKARMNKDGPHQGVLWAAGDTWREQRQFTLSTFRSFGVGKRSFQEQISFEVRALCDEISKFEGHQFDPRKLISNAVSNIICAVILGKRFEYSDQTFHELIRLLDWQLERAGSGAVAMFIPILSYFNLSSTTEEEILTVGEQLKQYFIETIEDHTKLLDSVDLRDYIDVYLDEIKVLQSEHNTSHLSVNNIVATIIQLFAAGTETTTTTLRWALLYMIAYPEIQQKVQLEIDTVVGRNRLPNLSDKEHLPYTEATIMEVQRLASIVPLGVPHSAAKDTTLGGFNIPKDTIIMSNIWAIHHDPRLWEAPDSFRPDRFLDGCKLAIQPESYIPFSAGRRVCLGENLAKMELFLFFSHLMHRYSFRKPQDSTGLSLTGIMATTNSPHNYELIAICRD